MLNILNRFRGKRAKKRLEYSLAAVGLTAVTVLAVAVTSAFMTARTDEKVNLFKPYTVTNTTAVEEHDGNYTPEGSDYTVDGTTGVTTDKKFSVANPKGDRMKAVYVRVYPVITGESKTTGDGSDYEELTSVEINNDSSTLGSGWVPGEDGYYYYKYVLEPGYRTPDLFENGNITFKNLDTEDNNTINLTFIADTVQAWANGSSETDTRFVKTAWGSITPGGVTLETTTSPDAVQLNAGDKLD